MRSYHVTDLYLLDSLVMLLWASPGSVSVAVTHTLDSGKAVAGIGALSIVKKEVPFAERASQANFAVSLDQGRDNVGDAHIGGSQDRTRLVLSEQLIAWYCLNLWLPGIQVT